MKSCTQLITPGFLKVNSLPGNIFSNRHAIIIIKPHENRQTNKKPKGSEVLLWSNRKIGCFGSCCSMESRLWEGELGCLDEKISIQNIEGMTGLSLTVCCKMWKEWDKLLKELSSKRGAELGSVGMQQWRSQDKLLWFKMWSPKAPSPKGILLNLVLIGNHWRLWEVGPSGRSGHWRWAL